MKTVVFLGGGRITSALAAGLRLAGYVGPLVVYDRNPQKLRALRREARVQIARNLKFAVAQAETLILAVRPASIAEMLDEVAACGARPGLCVSLAAGVPLKRLRALLGTPARWARAMPSPVCRIGSGLTAVCFQPSVSSSERARVRGLFAQVGRVVDVPELHFDAFTAAFSPSHGYHALATLAKAAQHAGLDRATALAAAAHALGEGISYWEKTGSSLNDLLHEAATPGGTAAATISAMNDSGFERAVARGVTAGIRQARRNAKR